MLATPPPPPFLNQTHYVASLSIPFLSSSLASSPAPPLPSPMNPSPSGSSLSTPSIASTDSSARRRRGSVRFKEEVSVSTYENVVGSPANSERSLDSIGPLTPPSPSVTLPINIPNSTAAFRTAQPSSPLSSRLHGYGASQPRIHDISPSSLAPFAPFASIYPMSPPKLPPHLSEPLPPLPQSSVHKYLAYSTAPRIACFDLRDNPSTIMIRPMEYLPNSYDVSVPSNSNSHSAHNARNRPALIYSGGISTTTTRSIPESDTNEPATTPNFHTLRLKIKPLPPSPSSSPSSSYSPVSTVRSPHGYESASISLATCSSPSSSSSSLPHFPWLITIWSGAESYPLTVYMVLEQLHLCLRTQVTRDEMNACDRPTKDRAEAAFARRMARLGDVDRKVEEAKGLRRVDFLGEWTMWGGLTKSLLGDDDLFAVDGVADVWELVVRRG